MDPFSTQVFPKRTSAASKGRRFVPLVIGLCLGLPLLGVALNALFTKTEPGKHKMVTQITLVAPPPPPPPPKPEEKPPDPPKMKEEVKLDNPKPTEEPKPAQEQPPAGPLGVDAQGSGPGDGFGLAGRPGGRDLIASSNLGGGGLGMTVFGSSVARHIAQELGRDPKLKNVSYRIEVRVWLAKDGRFEREEILKGTGDQELDSTIREGLRQLSAYQQTMPSNAPRSMRIRVISSDA
jgi:protein TonB